MNVQNIFTERNCYIKIFSFPFMKKRKKKKYNIVFYFVDNFFSLNKKVKVPNIFTAIIYEIILFFLILKKKLKMFFVYFVSISFFSLNKKWITWIFLLHVITTIWRYSFLIFKNKKRNFLFFIFYFVDKSFIFVE